MAARAARVARRVESDGIDRIRMALERLQRRSRGHVPEPDRVVQ